MIFTLYREPEMTEVARVVINARDLHDVSHVTFRFPSIPDSVNARYRFTLTSPDSTPGNAVTIWYAPADVYAAGAHYEGDKAMDVRFPPVAATADRYLKVIVRADRKAVTTFWSRLRPPGELPLSAEGNSTLPSGGLVFNVGYASDFPLAAFGNQTISGAYQTAWRDPGFFALYLAAILAVIGWSDRSLIRRGAHGR